jgi:hypothetical protein
MASTTSCHANALERTVASIRVHWCMGAVRRGERVCVCSHEGCGAKLQWSVSASTDDRSKKPITYAITHEAHNHEPQGISAATILATPGLSK